MNTASLDDIPILMGYPYFDGRRAPLCVKPGGGGCPPGRGLGLVQPCLCPETASNGKTCESSILWKRRFLGCLDGPTRIGANTLETAVFLKGSL